MFAVLQPYMLYIKIGLMIVALAGAGYGGYRYRDLLAKEELVEQVKSTLDKYEARDSKYIADQKDLSEWLKAKSLETEDIRKGMLSVQSAVANKKFTVEIPNAKGCSDVRLNDAFRLCFNAAITRTPEDIAACKASGAATPLPKPSQSLPATDLF